MQLIKFSLLCAADRLLITAKVRETGLPPSNSPRLERLCRRGASRRGEAHASSNRDNDNYGRTGETEGRGGRANDKLRRLPLPCEKSKPSSPIPAPSCSLFYRPGGVIIKAKRILDPFKPFSATRSLWNAPTRVTGSFMYCRANGDNYITFYSVRNSVRNFNGNSFLLLFYGAPCPRILERVPLF